MSSSLRSQPLGASGGVSDCIQKYHDETNWTEIRRWNWAIQVCGDKNKPVRIYHLPCYEVERGAMMSIRNMQWWGPHFELEDCEGSKRINCWRCHAKLGVEEQEFLLKAWELYVL